jgi:hypothetical protein
MLKNSIFATALGKSQGDRAYFKNLYKFNPKTELREYNLPFYENPPALGKSSSGFIKNVKLPPIQRENTSHRFIDQEDEDFEEKVITVPNCR